MEGFWCLGLNLYLENYGILSEWLWLIRYTVVMAVEKLGVLK